MEDIKTQDNLKKFELDLIQDKTAWWQMELPSGNVIVSESKAKMIGYPIENFKTYEDFTKLVHPEDYEKAMEAMRGHLEGKKPAYETLYRIKSNTGEYITLYDYGRITQKEGNTIKLIGFVTKIENIENSEKEIQYFKNLLTEGTTTIIEMFAQAQKIQK